MKLAAVGFLLAATIATFSVCTAAQRLPSDVELRAAYCSEVIKEEIADVEQLMKAAKEEIARRANSTSQEPKPGDTERMAKLVSEWEASQIERNHALSRLRFYLVPRVSHLDTVPLEGAMATARADKSLFKDKMNNALARCTTQCLKSADVNSCVYGCVGVQELQTRFELCRKPTTWLPF